MKVKAQPMTDLLKQCDDIYTTAMIVAQRSKQIIDDRVITIEETEDVEDSSINLSAIDLLTTSFRMDRLPVGGSALTWAEIITQWKEDIEQCVLNRREAFPIP